MPLHRTPRHYMWDGSAIKLAREQAGFSQRELARLAHTDQAQLSRLEVGERNTTTILLLADLAAALGLSPGTLLDRCLEQRKKGEP